jgi:hypothetical protein
LSVTVIDNVQVDFLISPARAECKNTAATTSVNARAVLANLCVVKQDFELIASSCIFWRIRILSTVRNQRLRVIHKRFQGDAAKALSTPP